MNDTQYIILKRIIPVLLFCTMGLVCFSQTLFSGVVKDTGGEPLIGVNVMWGEGQGTSTDLDGRFSMEVHKTKYSETDYGTAPM